MTEPQRLALHAAARTVLGDEEGDTLMALTPPANTDLATMQALERVDERLTGRMEALEERLTAQMRALEERLTGRMEALDERLTAQMRALEERLEARIQQVVGESHAALTRSLHHAELRTMSVIVLAFLGTNLLG